MSKKKKGKDKSKDKNKDKKQKNKKEKKENPFISSFLNTDTSFVDTGLGKFTALATLTDKHIKMSQGLAFITGSLKEQAQLQDRIFASAQRSGSSYESMANTITQMSIAAGNSFKNDELVSFVELAQKSLKIGGASDEQIGETMNVLTEAMKTGTLDEGGFDNIMQNAPQIAESIAEEMGKSKDELRDMASQGLLTANLIKNAMLEASNEINENFKQVPMTFEDVWTKISNTATKALSPVLDVISEIVNSDGFNEFIDNICVGIEILSGAVLWIVEAIRKYWDVFGSIIAGMTIAVLGVLIAQTTMLAAKWLYACWPILAVGAAIAYLIYMFNACGITFKDVFCFIYGAVEALKVIFYNLGVLINNVFVELQDVIYTFCTGILNGALKKINEAILWSNKHCDTNYGTFELFGKYDDSYYREYKDVSDAYNSGKEKGAKLFDNTLKHISGANNPFKMPNIDKWSGNQSPNSSSQNSSSNNNIDTNTNTNVNSQVNMNNKDKDYLREAAERNYIGNFATTTISPTISVVFEGSGNTSNDEKLAKRISKILTEQIAMVAEGVY